MSASLNHALHNEKVCLHLAQTDEFSDWVITTAFYASLHFVKHRIFPLKQTAEGGHSFKVPDFDTYCKGHNPRKLNKHSLLSDLVDEHCDSISTHYDRLKDMCWTARYNQYNFTPAMSQLAVSLLQKIKPFCVEKGSKQTDMFKK